MINMNAIYPFIHSLLLHILICIVTTRTLRVRFLGALVILALDGLHFVLPFNFISRRKKRVVKSLEPLSVHQCVCDIVAFTRVD